MGEESIKCGTIVTVKGVNFNGHDEQPAIVTYVWTPINEGQATVNVKVFPDMGEPFDLTSIFVFTDPAKLEAYIQDNPSNQVAHIG